MTSTTKDAAAARRPITILWATQSGRAKACARRTIRLLHSSLGISPNNIQGQCSFDDFGADRFLSLGHQQPRGSLLLMFVSTTGDAEQCTSMASTWSKLLSKSLPNTTFQHCQFALFALGDRAYGPDAYCAAGRKVAARLNQLSAIPICTLGYGDDGSLNGGVFADLDVWLEEQLFPTLKTMVGGGQLKLFDSSSLLQVKDEKEIKMYTVTTSHQIDSVEKDAVALHEWQNERYQQYYANYFKHSCPATAYQYNGELNRCTTSTSTQLDCKTPPLVGRVSVNNRITADDWMQNTRHIRINVTAATKQDKSTRTSTNVTELPYQAGDVATILPSNPQSLVSRFLSVLPTEISSIADDTIHIQYNQHHSQTSMNNHPWPQYCTLRGLLTHCADIAGLPEREDLFALSSFCNPNHEDGNDHREKLISLSETSGAALYGDYIIREKRNWADVLYDFDSIRFEEGGVKLTLEDLLGLLPSLAPRHFSIASSPSFLQITDSPTSSNGFDLELCVAVVEGSTPFGRPYTGCCSKYLETLTPCSDETTSAGSDAVRLWIHPGSFSNLPLDIRENPISHHHFTTPVLYVGAGTGIAPLRSLILEREAVLMKNGAAATSPFTTTGEDTGDGIDDNVLVFGCRSKAKDYYYGEEWERLVTTKRLRTIPAFSRDQKIGKLYVQRALREADGGSGKLIVQHILEHNGAIYIAGGSKMARAVKDEIVEALTNTIGSEKTAKKLLHKLKRIGKFSIEAWS
ncbi:hypothetical protein ACHAWT_010193 [Skeletonema menzelii]